jgi:hypothetical protein
MSAVGMMEITLFRKSDGPLTKIIRLDGDKPVSDGGACMMARGKASRFRFDRLDRFAEMLDHLDSAGAIALGALRSDLPEEVAVVTHSRLKAHPAAIARTTEYIGYRPGEPALALIDFDKKGMPANIVSRVDELGGLWPALLSVVPEIEKAASLVRSSTSAGLYRTDTGKKFPGLGGSHVYIILQNGSDIERFLKALHERCWLAGFGWMIVGAGGQLLERSIVDRVVGSPERLVFEGPPVLVKPLAQDQTDRRPRITEGVAVDSLTCVLPITVVEGAKLNELRAKESIRLDPERTNARQAWVMERIKAMVDAGVAPDKAKVTIERIEAGVLRPDVLLEFDDPDLEGGTVADVLRDPDRFVGATLADPLEGLAYGRDKAKIQRRADDTMWIHSFAHGGTVYQLKLDFDTCRAAIAETPSRDVANVFVDVALRADLDPAQIEQLIDLVQRIIGIGKRPLDQMLKTARQQRKAAEAEQRCRERAAARTDPRPQLPVPSPDAEYLPVMAALTEVLGASTAAEPPMRDLDHAMIRVVTKGAVGMHELTPFSANAEDGDAEPLPAWTQPTLLRYDEPALAEEVERHIEYIAVTKEGVSPVHLPGIFVKHFLVRRDDNKDKLQLPIVRGIVTLPIVTPFGELRSGRGLDRASGIIYRIPDELLRVVPNRKDCSDPVVTAAMRFLMRKWLCDVTTNFQGKCVAIACAMTIIERTLLESRPCFWITAGQRGGGKTTLLKIISTAITGFPPPAAAWSPHEEERRKALLAYLSQGLPFLVWDNIKRSTQIACPYVEAACTSFQYSDRKLGVTEFLVVPATTIFAYTGNNIGPKGDLTSRSLETRLTVDRPDPENRKFTHPDPIGWTLTHRGQILRALYTIMLGNPLLGTVPERTETRNKLWWYLIGSAIEHAAMLMCEEENSLLPGADPDPTCPTTKISFKDALKEEEDEDDHTLALRDVLVFAMRRWPTGFKASDMQQYLADTTPQSLAIKDALEIASGKPIEVISTKRVTDRLKSIRDAVVYVDDVPRQLVYFPNDHGGTFRIDPVRQRDA